MSLKRSVTASYLGAGVVALAPLLALPWYLHALGPTQFGLVGFVTALQALLNILDAGMSQSLVREVSLHATRAHDQGRRRAASTLYGYERIYWICALVGGSAIALMAQPIAEHWLDLPVEQRGDGQQAILGAAAIFMAMFPGALYRSFLVGSEKQITLNAILALCAVLRHLGAALAVWWHPTLAAYLVWHAAMGLVETSLRGAAAWRAAQHRRDAGLWDTEQMRHSWRDMRIMIVASVAGALGMQMDKILLSRLVPIETFGIYAIASTAAGGCLQLTYPLMQAVAPRALRLARDPEALRRLYSRVLILMGVAIVAAAVAYGTAGQALLAFWLRSETSAKAVFPLLALLLLGVALNALYNVGYTQWLVQGRMERILHLNLFSLAACLLAVPFFVAHFGVQGAASGWLVINALGLAVTVPSLWSIVHDRAR